MEQVGHSVSQRRPQPTPQELWSWEKGLHASMLTTHWMWAGSTREGHKHGQGCSLCPEERLSCQPPMGSTGGTGVANVSVSDLNLMACLDGPSQCPQQGQGPWPSVTLDLYKYLDFLKYIFFSKTEKLLVTTAMEAFQL